jgi:oxaloacetate decarboxylase gamma subunit
MSEMEIALELLGVGMVTVFIILALVVVLGDLIIRIVNRFMPEIQKLNSPAVEPVAATQSNPKKLAAIVSAINIVTKGTGRVSKIEKL